jgi:subtilisin family serine protease
MKGIFIPLFMLLAISVSAQSLQSTNNTASKELPEQVKKDWFNLDYDSDKIYGTSTNKTFEEYIKTTKPKKRIVVAVIDSGVDWEHEDLSENIWTNPNEIAGNNIDDDKNGYVDDVHGWNFLVDDEGGDITMETMEATRILKLSKDLRETEGEYPAWLTNAVINQALEIYNKEVASTKSLEKFRTSFGFADSVMLATEGEEYTIAKALTLDENANNDYKRAKLFFTVMNAASIDLKDLTEMAEHYDESALYQLNMDFVTRKSLKPDQKFYGNNHYECEHAEHGTHVAGIIAASRTNAIGTKGIASNCTDIMILRAVPNGDEHDVDVANSIRYAVDNGANIINMSFGKGLSPHKELVTEALQYASENNVLIVHAAGNDSENNDEVSNYPNIDLVANQDNMSFLSVGALNTEKNKYLLASFTNYGDQSLDIFAPGSDIYSTLPDNEYEYFSGTSMAAPVVSGVAALVWAFHPELSALELKNALIESSIKLPKKKVVLPGTAKDKVRLIEISKNAGLVNTYSVFTLLK